MSAVIDCARCGTRHYGAPVAACVFCGAPFRTGDERKGAAQCLTATRRCA